MHQLVLPRIYLRIMFILVLRIPRAIRELARISVRIPATQIGSRLVDGAVPIELQVAACVPVPTMIVFFA